MYVIIFLYIIKQLILMSSDFFAEYSFCILQKKYEMFQQAITKKKWDISINCVLKLRKIYNSSSYNIKLLTK